MNLLIDSLTDRGNLLGLSKQNSNVVVCKCLESFRFKGRLSSKKASKTSN